VAPSSSSGSPTTPFSWSPNPLTSSPSEQPEFLADYPWRLNHASEDVLGFDLTIKPFEGASFHRHFPGYKGPLYQATVPSREASGQGEAYVIPTQDLRRLTSPFGRGTRSTRAVLVRDSDHVHFLKDYWRVKGDGLKNEGEIYGLLEGANVPHIAPFVSGNDVDGDHHTTIGHQYEGSHGKMMTNRTKRERRQYQYINTIE